MSTRQVEGGLALTPRRARVGAVLALVILSACTWGPNRKADLTPRPLRPSESGIVQKYLNAYLPVSRALLGASQAAPGKVALLAVDRPRSSALAFPQPFGARYDCVRDAVVLDVKWVIAYLQGQHHGLAPIPKWLLSYDDQLALAILHELGHRQRYQVTRDSTECAPHQGALLFEREEQADEFAVARYLQDVAGHQASVVSQERRNLPFSEPSRMSGIQSADALRRAILRAHAFEQALTTQGPPEVQALSLAWAKHLSWMQEFVDRRLQRVLTLPDGALIHQLDDCGSEAVILDSKSRLFRLGSDGTLTPLPLRSERITEAKRLVCLGEQSILALGAQETNRRGSLSISTTGTFVLSSACPVKVGMTELDDAWIVDRQAYYPNLITPSTRFLRLQRAGLLELLQGNRHPKQLVSRTDLTAILEPGQTLSAVIAAPGTAYAVVESGEELALKSIVGEVVRTEMKGTITAVVDHLADAGIATILRTHSGPAALNVLPKRLGTCDARAVADAFDVALTAAGTPTRTGWSVLASDRDRSRIPKQGIAWPGTAINTASCELIIAAGRSPFALVFDVRAQLPR